MHNNSIFKQILLVVSVVLFVSCDKDYNVIGDGLIGENHFDLAKETYDVVAYNQKIGPVQSNNLPINALGIYDNPAFGKTTANFATQLTLATVGPTFGEKPEIESVYIDIPYFVDASQTKPITTGGNTYVLDSIYGAPLAKIKLSVFESGLYMRDKDPVGGFQEAQMYFTNQNTDFDNLKIGSRLNDAVDVSQNDAFFFDPTQHSVTTKDDAGKETTTYTAPSMRLKLNSQFFMDKIINAPAGKLTSNEIFKEYFKGLYFKVEQSGTDPGSLAMINFAKGTITIKYKENTSSTDATRIERTIVLNLSGNTVSLLEQSNTNADYANATNNANPVLGDEKLYLKGGEGSLAVIELFGPDLHGEDGTTGGPNGVADQLDIIRKKGWLINQAQLVFNIDTENTDFAKSYEPERVYLYDFTNSRATLDYYSYSGKITKDAASPKRGTYYKLNLTSHIRSLVKHTDSTNIKLGIAVTENIEIPDFYKLRTPTAFLSKAPKASVMNPLGTILYGGKSSIPESKRLKLEIYYTKPN